MYEVVIAEGIANKLNSDIVTFMIEDAPTLKSCVQYKNVFINHACNRINCENMGYEVLCIQNIT
jgi:hypothetical protein